MSFFRLALRSHGYSVLEATTIAQTLELEPHLASLDLLLADVKLPDGSGISFAGELIGRCPTLPVLFVSGTPIEGWTSREQSTYQMLRPATAGFLLKPFVTRDLRLEIDRLLAAA